MALNLKFNAKNGISVGLSSIPVIDNVGDATFNSISASSNISVSGTLNQLSINSTSISFPARSAQNVIQSINSTASDEMIVGNTASGKRVIIGGGAQDNFVRSSGMSTTGLVVGSTSNAVAGIAYFAGDVGIGASSPTAKFDVVGNGLFRSATTTDGATLKVTNGSTAQCTFGFGAGGNAFPGIWLNQPSPTFSNYAFLGSTADTFFNAPFNGFIYFRNNNSTRMMVDKSGVHIPGIPLVANPTTHQLTVSSTAPTKIGIVVQGATSQTADLQQWTNSSNTALAKINNEGDIEITNFTNGIILKSPDGTRYRITVTNGGALSSTDLTPPAPTTPPPMTTTPSP